MYGSRDASQIWETCYTDALLNMGFTHGISSPCVFRHDGWGVQVVVHGGDFTALGNDQGLDRYEAEMAKAFEVSMKRILSHDDNDEKRMQVLNKILKVTSKWLLYEPDPRHIELLAQAQGIDGNCNKPVTPGKKPPAPDDLIPGESIDDIINAIRCIPPPYKTKFSDNVATYHIAPYAETFLIHPSKLLLTNFIDMTGKLCDYIHIKHKHDIFTGLDSAAMNLRHAEFRTHFTTQTKLRTRKLRHVLHEHATW